MKPQDYTLRLYFHKFDRSMFRSHFMRFLDENDIPGIVSHEFSLGVFEYHYEAIETKEVIDYVKDDNPEYVIRYGKYKYLCIFDCTFLNLHLNLEWGMV